MCCRFNFQKSENQHHVSDTSASQNSVFSEELQSKINENASLHSKVCSRLNSLHSEISDSSCVVIKPIFCSCLSWNRDTATTFPTLNEKWEVSRRKWRNTSWVARKRKCSTSSRWTRSCSSESSLRWHSLYSSWRHSYANFSFLFTFVGSVAAKRKGAARCEASCWRTVRYFFIEICQMFSFHGIFFFVLSSQQLSTLSTNLPVDKKSSHNVSSEFKNGNVQDFECIL